MSSHHLRAIPRPLSGSARPRDDKKAHALEVNRLLKKTYADAHCELNHQGPFQLLAATILSAQCTDVRVNRVTPILFKKYRTAQDFAKAKLPDLCAIVRSTGFYQSKAKNIIGAARAIVDQHGGKVPQTMEELFQLPGVGRKTANVVLGNAFGKSVGVVVDTHVRRISRKLGLTRHNDPVKIEQDLMKLLPQNEWTDFSHRMIFHGRQLCKAISPNCPECPLNRLCPSAEL